MPNIDYLRQLSLIKKGYTPSEAGDIVENEIIRKFQNESTEIRDSYRKYYSSLFSNAGTNVSSTSSVASTEGLISSQPAPSTNSSSEVNTSSLVSPQKSNVPIKVNTPEEAQNAFKITNTSKPVVLPGGTIPPRTNKTVSSDSPFFIPSTRGNYLREMEAPLPDPITDWVNPNSRQLNYQKNLFEERVQTNRTSSEDFSSLFDPQIPQSEKIDKAFALKYKLENELKGIVIEPEVVTGRYKVDLQKEEVQKNKNKEKYQLALQQIDQIIEGQNLQLVAQAVLNNPKAKELIQPILSGQPVPADVQKNILGRISSVLGQSENDILSSLTYLSNHRLDDPNKPPTRTDYGQAFLTYLNSKDESESAINGVAVQQQRAISEDLVSINAKLMNAIGNEIVNQQIKGTKKVEELLQEVENFPNFENLTNPEKQKIVDGYNTQINAVASKLKENSEIGKALIETDLQIDNKTDWRLNNAKEGIAAQAKQQAAADLNAGLERAPYDIRNITFLNDLVSGIVETIPRGIRNWQVSSAYDMAIKRAKLTAGGVELPAEGGKTVQDYQNEIKSSLKEYIQSDDYPVIDKIASAQVGRIISADQFFYFDDNAFLGFKMGRGIGRNMGPVLAQQLPSMLLSGGLMSIGGLTVKGILAARAAKTADSVLKTARLAKYAELTAGKTAQQIWRTTIRATASNNTGLAKFGIGLLESRVPTFLAVTASTYPSIYRQTVKELYANKVDDVEKKAKVLAWWSSAIEGLTEGFFPDIDIISAQRYLPKESAFLRFAGRPFKNLQDYMDLVSIIPDLSPASKKLLAQTAYKVKKGLIVSGKVAKTGYKIGFNPGEGFEEVVAELGNHFLNSVYATERGADAEELSPESLINAFAGGAFMTAPMGAVRAGSFYRENDIQSAYRMANSPEFYKDKINKSLQKGKISQEQAIKALAQIDNYTKIVKSKPFRNLVDESTFMEDEEAQYDYFRAVLNKVGNDAFTLDSKDFAKLSDEDKEAYIKNAEEISKDIENYERRSSAFEKLTEQEKKTRLIDIAKKNVTAYFPVTSLRELEKKKEEHERERAVAQINYKESFDKVKEPLDFVISEVDRVYQERVQAIQEAKDNGTLNPLLEDAYAEEGQEKQAGIDAMDLNEVEKLLIQASLNPDTEGILDEAFQILGMYQEAEETKNEVEKQVLKEIAKRRGTPTAQLTETDLTPEEIEYLIEQKQKAEDIFDRIVQKGNSFIEALIKKFEPMIRANKITGEEIFNRLLSPEMYYSLLFLKNAEISQKEFVDFESFNELWNRTTDFREGFIEDQKKQQEEAREAQRKEEAKRAQDALEAKEREEEKTPEELEDDSTPPQETDLKVDRVAAITDFNRNLKTQADYYTDPNSSSKNKKTSKRKLRSYILGALNKEQAIARAMFVASLKNEDTPELEALLNRLFSAPAEFFAEETNNDLLNNFEVGKLLSSKKNDIPAFTNSVIVEEVVEPKEEQIEEEKVEEKEKVEETPEEPTESEDTSKFEDSENYKFSYFISYSNRDRKDPKSKNHIFAKAAQKVTIQILNNRPLYKIQVTDLFSFLKNNKKAQAVTQLEKYYNEYLNLKQEGDSSKLKEFRQEVTKFFETTFSGILPPKELDYHLNKIFFGNYNGIGEKTTSEKQGFKDLNVILGYVTKDGNIVRFDDEGNVNDSGPNLYTLTISRDEKYKSARLGNAIRKHVRDRGEVSISDLSIDFGYDYTTNEESVGFTASIPDVDTALQALEEVNTLPIVKVKPAVVPVVETPVEPKIEEQKPTAPTDAKADLEAKKADIERRRQGENNRFPSGETTFKKINPDGENTEVTDKQKATIERVIDGNIKDGKTPAQIVEILNQAGYTVLFGNETTTLMNYLEDRISGAITTPFFEFNNKLRDKINAKYDAELAALESFAPQVEENITSQEEVDSNVSPLDIISGAASVQEEAPVAGAKKFTPTAEQQAVIDAAKKGGNVVVRALAGTGKTTTLIQTMEALAPNLPEGKRILYVVFNRSAKEEAKAKMARFGNKVEVRTRDSLARQALLNDLRTSHLPEKAGRQLKAETKVHFKDELRILDLKDKKIGSRVKAKHSILKLIKQIVDEYAIGSDTSIKMELVEKVMLQNKTFSKEVENNYVTADEYTYILELAQKYWQLSLSTNSEIPFRISHYMKVWSSLPHDLSSEYSVIMMDEAQDINPVTGEIFNNQPTQLIYVGDENQAIYEFIGATNQLENIVAENDLPLSTSWRFGPEIAELGNIILNYLGSNLRLKGKGGESKISQSKISDPNVIISRTNSGAIDFISAYVEQGKRVGIYSKQREQLFNLIAEIKWLKDKKGKNRPPVEDSPFDIYNTWDEVLESKENDPALTKILKLTNNGQTEELEELLKKTINIPEENPYSAEPYDILVTTAHKSKGGEWDNVQIADDFKPLSKTKWPGTQEFNLAYVAITRAKKNIGLGSLNQWIKTLESLEKESKEKPKGDSAPQQKSQPSAKTPTAPAAPTAPPPQPSPQPPVRREGPMPDKAQGNSAFEFAISSVKNLIKFSEKVGEPELTPAGNRVYVIGGKNYISQSAYNKKGDIEKTALLEDAVVMGDINDIIGRDVLGGVSLGEIEKYIPSVLEQVKAKQNLPELPKVDNEQIIKYIEELTALKNEWQMNGYTIFTDKVVLYADLQESFESKGETFEGVAGVPDIILVHDSGSVHIVDMKNIKFGSARDDIKPKFNEKRNGWETQQRTYIHLAQGILPKILSIGILGAKTSYEGKTLKNIGLLDLQPYGVKAQDTSISMVGRLGTNFAPSPFVSRPNVIFVENNSNPTNNSNNC